MILTGSGKPGEVKPTEKEVLDQLVVIESEITSYNETKLPEQLVTKLPSTGKIVKREENSKLGTKSFTLSNGAKVTYKKTDFKNDEVLFQAVSKGGTNLLPDDLYLQISSALSGVTEGGISGLKKTDLPKYYSGKFVSVAPPYIGSTSEGFSGQSNIKDLPYLFEGIYAYATAINYDSEAFKTFADKNLAFFKNILSQPSDYFNKEVADFSNAGNKRYIGYLPKESDYSIENYNKAYEEFKKRFENIGDFEFFFVGNINDKQIEELALKYISSLPSSSKREKIVDIGARSFTGEHKMIVNKGVDQ